MNKLLTFALGLMLVFGAACAEEEPYDTETGMEEGTTDMGVGQETDYYSEWDTDANQEISETEWNEGWGTTGLFDDWDMNRDQAISEEEFGGGTYGIWDEDESGYVDENEFNTWSERWFGNEYDYGTFGEWDADADAQLTEEEFGEGFRETGYYSEWDADADTQLTEDEFGEGLFGLWDENRNMALERNEYDTWGADWDLF